MIRQLVLGSLCIGALIGPGGDALANGRPPQTSTISFRKGMENQIAAGTAFGLLRSNDNGATWHWVCEDAIGYGGMYDPDYIYASTGTLLATTFDGVVVNRDGCTFEKSSLSPAPPSTDIKFFSTITQGPDNAILAAAADPLDGKIYKSTDDGVTWPTTSTAGQLNDWWSSIEVAPSNAMRVYLSGYRFVPNPDTDAGGNIKEFLLFSSTNGGASWTALPVTGFATRSNSVIEIVGIGKTNSDLVFAKVTLSDNAISDTLYRSVNGGATWTPILTKQGAISFIVRGNGDLVAATQSVGSFRSTNNGTDWMELVNAPHINCLSEKADGELWACTQNYGIPQVPPDGFGIMKTTDLVTWTGVLKFQEIQGPLACAVGTEQKDTCDEVLWCGLCAQLGCDPKRECPMVMVDAPPDAGEIGSGSKPGCCETTGSDTAPGALALVAAVGMVLLRSRRRPRRVC
ncbi:MAG: exo-alpha-sialidase [Deltaproteobacteria bacterium]|nr:exo-alpha-sialidase [Deltaproteobacteria bacterium]MDQ3298414.1 glycoside hydrolase [Myxococcota bacterium]